ncbi:hypothetical protein B0H11DRAFT_2430116 [Mycena galericulata]|nr:hypothetical protein B0H11DRAFT_2430116 [Mycena galericulata]
MSSSMELSDRPLHTKKIAELKSIAVAMGLDADLKKEPLLHSIQRHIKNTPAIADDHRFLPLFAHRTAPKAVGKTSAGKTSEDAVESSKALVATGANKTLLAEKITIDPPAQFAKLSVHKNDKATQPVIKSESRDDDSETSSEDEGAPAMTAPSPEPEHKAEMVAKQEISVVQVNFFDEKDHAAAPRQVFIDDVPVVVSCAADGTQKFTALLSELIPAAIKNDSPIKERGGRIYRPNIRDDPTHHHIGKIDALLSGTSSALKPKQMNEYTLRTAGDGSLICDVFWDQTAQVGSVAVDGKEVGSEGIQVEYHETAAKNVNSEGTKLEHLEYPIAAADSARSEGPRAEPLQFTGSGSDIPVEIAADRAKHNPMHKNATPELQDNFRRFLHKEVSRAVPGLPEYGEDWARCVLAGQMLDRFLKQKSAFAFLAGWSRTQGGYIVPKDFGEYSGIKFTKDVAYKALNIKSSNTTEITQWFSSTTLSNAPKAKAWVDSEGKTNDEKFRDMKTIRFKDYVSKNRKPAESSRRVRRRSSSPTHGDGPARKHRKKGAENSDSDRLDD